MGRPALPALAKQAKAEGRLISPSQVIQWGACPRKWAYKYVDKLPDPSGPAAALGTEVHTALEGQVQRGTVPRLDTKVGRIAAAMLHMIPNVPYAKLQVERHVAFPWTGRSPGTNAVYHGFIDLSWRATVGAPHPTISGQLARALFVQDYKTTGDLAWAKTEETLLECPQRIIYSAADLAEHEVDDIDLAVARWAYGCTRAAKGVHKTKLVTVSETPQEVLDRMTELHETAGVEIVAAYQKTSAQAERNRDHCGDYGGCPFQARCLVGAKKQTLGETLRMGSSALEKLKARKAARKAAAAGTTDTRTEEEKAPPRGATPRGATPRGATPKAKPDEAAAPNEAQTRTVSGTVGPNDEVLNETTRPADTEPKTPAPAPTPAPAATPKKTRKKRSDIGVPRGPASVIPDPTTPLAAFILVYEALKGQDGDTQRNVLASVSTLLDIE